MAATCDCGQQFKLYRGSDNREYESQTDTYRCGPVAVRNALRFLGRQPGRATMRRICTICDARPKQPDGFGGTYPDRLMAALTAVLPAAIHHTVGAAAVKQMMLDPKYKAFIVLYSGLKAGTRTQVRYYHYVFVWRDRSQYFVQNEMEGEEFIVRASQLDSEYLEECVRCDIQFPQCWALVQPAPQAT